MFDDERLPEGILPEDLSDLPSGPELGMVLASVDRDRLDGYDRVVLLKARARQLAYDQAELYADVYSIHEYQSENPDNRELFWTSDIDQMVASEIRAALTLTRRSADLHLGLAYGLCRQLPAVWKALRQRLIDLAKARVIIDQTSHLEEGTARLVADLALERASCQTTGQLAARIRKLTITADPDAAKKRYQEGLEQRRVTAGANEEGTANLHGFDLPATDTHAAMRRINRLARGARTADDPRTMDQLRADVFLDLLLGRRHQVRDHGDRAVIDLKADLTTLAGLDDNPGEIPGWGPVIADITRQIVEEQPDAGWRYIITGQDGTVVHSGTTRRRPTTSQKRHIQARNPTCVFPGCRIPATDCDIDHNQAWSEGGPTEEHNLAPFCRHDHVVKHHGWKTRQIRPGIYQHTSPLGHTYLVGPDPP